MLNLQCGLATAATGSFRRFVPKIYDFSQICSHATCLPLTPPWTHYAGSAGGKGQCRNYQDLTKDPPELAKLYDRVYKTDHRPTLKVFFLRKCGLDADPKSPRLRGGQNLSLSAKNSEYSVWSKHSLPKNSKNIQYKKDKTKSKMSGSKLPGRKR